MTTKRFVGPPEQRFWRFVQRTEGCWLWIGGKGARGRGTLAIRKNGITAHLSAVRLSYEMHFGPIEDKHAVILQSCGNRLCVNPGHLFLKRGPRQPASLEGRFWSFVNKTDGCWEWTGGRHVQGYGQIKIADGYSGKLVRSHRLSYELHFGPIPDGMDVLHHCDNPPCVNPKHLYLGTIHENMADKVNRHRQPTCESHPSAKLNWEKVRLIREIYAGGGRSQSDIAAEFGVTQILISKIVRKVIWREDGV